MKATISKLALRILFESCITNDVRYYASDGEECYPLLDYSDLNRAKYVKFGADIRLVEVI